MDHVYKNVGFLRKKRAQPLKDPHSDEELEKSASDQEASVLAEKPSPLNGDDPQEKTQRLE